AGRGVEREDLAPGASDVHHAVNDYRRGLLPAIRIEVVIPRQSERSDVLLIDFLERAESLFTVIAPVAHPISRLMVGADYPGAVHVRGLSFLRIRVLSRPRDARIQNRQSKNHHGDSQS